MAKPQPQAHINEGTTNALRGRRLVPDDDDLLAFQHTLPPTSSWTSLALSLPSPVSPTCPIDTQSHNDPAHPDASLFILTTRLTLNLSTVCRRIHAILTGPKAHRSPVDSLDENGLRGIWEGLERCWDEFVAARRNILGAGSITIGSISIGRFVSNWQIFIFECHKY